MDKAAPDHAAVAALGLTEDEIGFIFFCVSIGYCVLIILFDSIAKRRLAVSKNLLRHLLDGLTFATGVTVGLAIHYHNIFPLVASNFTYITVTSVTCIFGPALNMAERYGWMIDT
jgi:hypothetical protein